MNEDQILLELLANCSEEMLSNYEDTFAKIVYEKSKHQIPLDACKIQAQNTFERVKRNSSNYENSTVEELADAIIWSFNQ